MIPRTPKRARLKFGLAVAATLALSALAVAGSAAAATQHWASAHQVPSATPAEFTGKATGWSVFRWEPGGADIEFECNSLSTTGTVENPVGRKAGNLDAGAFSFGGCSVNTVEGCVIQGESIDLAPMSAQATTASGKDLITYKPVGSSYYGIFDLEAAPGMKCALSASYPIRGQLSAAAIAGAAGEYELKPSELTIAGAPVHLSGRYSLTTPTKEALVLSSSASAGTPRWYLGSAKWTNLSTGTSTTFSTPSGSMSFDLESELYGIPVEVSCTGVANSLAGSLKNPTGGGAGTASAEMSLNGCSVSTSPYEFGCTVETPIQLKGLTGLDVEVAGSPALELAGAGGKFGNLILQECILAGTYALSGQLIPISLGDHFEFTGKDNFFLGGEWAGVTGEFELATEPGRILRIQP